MKNKDQTGNKKKNNKVKSQPGISYYLMISTKKNIDDDCIAFGHSVEQ